MQSLFPVFIDDDELNMSKQTVPALCMHTSVWVHSPTAGGPMPAVLPSVLPPGPAPPLTKPLNGLRDSASPAPDWLVSVRGLKCLQRHALMFRRICLRSEYEVWEEEGEDCDKEDVLVEVTVWEVVSVWRGEAGKEKSGSESRLWNNPFKSE